MKFRAHDASGGSKFLQTGMEEVAATAVGEGISDLPGGTHLAEISTVGHWKVCFKTGALWINAAFAEQSLGLIANDGRTYRTRLDETLGHYIHPDDRPQIFDFIARVTAVPEEETQDAALSCRVIRPDGELRYLTVLVKGGCTQESVLEGVIQDITAQRQAEAAIRESEAFFRAVLETTANLLTVIGTDHCIRYYNRTAGEYLSQLLGRPIRMHAPMYEYILPKYQNKVRSSVEAAIRGETLQYETSIPHPDGTHHTFEVCYAPIRDECHAVIAVLLSYRDISEQKQSEQQIIHMAYHDPLTGLPNRRYFYDCLEERLKQIAVVPGQKLAVVLFDLDHFKLVNDSLGHLQGDELLLLAVTRIRSCVRERDLLARIGGDEFILMLPDLEEEEEAVRLVDCMLNSLKEPFTINGHEIRTSMSLGISFYPEHGEDAQTLIRHADMAMYWTKDNGRNGYRTFAPDMNVKLQHRVKLEKRLLKAIDRQEFSLHYQPKVNLETGRIYGIEALIRWKMPEGGMIPPSEFIPVAEECGLIVPIGDWVLRTACQENKKLQEEGFEPLVMSVNLSARQFAQPDLADQIERILLETGLAPQWLELEITETILMASPPEAAATLNRLKELGVSLSVDDFGTGFSSLNYLKYFPIDVLKVDSSFVKDVPHGPKDIAITKSIIGLAHNLQLQAIAEGVETAEQLAFLQDQGCDAIQGYYISTPLKADELRQRLIDGGHSHHAVIRG